MDKQMNLVLRTRGKTENIGTAAAVMRELSRHIWMNGKKFRVTIDCDPRANQFEISRYEFNESS